MRRRAASIAFSLCALLAPREAAAQSSPVVFKAETLLGEAGRGTGWSEILATLDNDGKSPITGTVTIKQSSYAPGSDGELVSSTLVTLPEGRRTIVRLPIFTNATTMASTASFEMEGKPPMTVDLSSSTQPTSSLLDLHQTSRLSALRDWPLSIASATYGAPPTLTIATAIRDVATGDPILPMYAASYAATSVVLVPSDVFVRLDDRSRHALVDYLISGGTFAFAVARTDDLRHPAVIDLLGGEAREVPPPDSFKLLPVLVRPTGKPPIGGGRMRFDTPAPNGDSPYQWTRTDRVGQKERPTYKLADGLHGYVGAKIEMSDTLPVVTYGLGTIYMLPADPGVLPYSEDAWLHSRLVEIVTAARVARESHLTKLGSAGNADLRSTRKVLDPNQSFQIPLGLSAVLLLVFAVLAGPVLFGRAAKQKRPFAPLKWVPIASAATFFAVVLIGVVTKGIRGKVRRLTISEARIGSDVAAVKRLRGYYFGGSTAFTVKAEDEWSVLRPFVDSGNGAKGALVLDREGLSLTKMPVDPWRTTVVIDEGVESLGGTIELKAENQTAILKNSFSFPLLNVFATSGRDANVYFFDSIPAGGTVKISDGVSYGSGTMRPIAGFVSSGTATGDLWTAVQSTSADNVNWFPRDTPVVLAELDRSPKHPTDMGFGVEREKSVIRFLGKAQK